ncbi:hypothetical protein AC477_05565 [miscellaneous Crenarchaeota group-1 archaeon SG8-32-1]|uniref:Uncharacterized protein n=1 Tax=miscellaneous Crenarchaeota group-1 archaeon SG8-32-1 TaxID=1685124 RepID=A0A0M0BMT9_9ARCH|nr:MAG: hypothetical protein AC477_05565 [miscellaneous Crenarchaeota group-1 archaeon SG8-32-1]
MTSETNFKIRNITDLLFPIFYIVVGIALAGYFVIENIAAPPHILVVGILSLITAYSLFKKEKWTLPLVIGFFFTGITFGIITLANSVTLQTFGGSVLFHITLIVYMVMLLIASVYILIKKEKFS